MSLHSLYQLLVAPKSRDVNVQNKELVLNWLLLGSFILTLVAFLNTFFSWVALNDDYLLDRLLPISAFLVFFGSLLVLSRRTQQHRLPSLILVVMLLAAAIAVVYQWSIINPVGILLFSLVIVMASILLGARFALYVALLTIITLSVLEIAKAHQLVQPDLSWEKQPSSPTDVVSFSAIFAVLALTSWLFNRRMELALTRAEQSERALKRQRDLLEVTVEQRTRALQAAQIEQVQQVYRFAELGHLSTALFHDLANHLMSVSIDIEGLQKRRRSDLLLRIQDNVRHIDGVVKRVQRQIRGHAGLQRFDVIDEIQGVIKMLAYFSNKKQVSIQLESLSGSSVHFSGDLTRFRQIVTNLLSNAIEAYPNSKRTGQKRSVIITVTRQAQDVIMTFTDRGKRIRPAVQARIFEPFYTTKSQGMGIGLFIVKKVVEEDFGGSLSLNSSSKAGTTFTCKNTFKKACPDSSAVLRPVSIKGWCF